MLPYNSNNLVFINMDLDWSQITSKNGTLGIPMIWNTTLKKNNTSLILSETDQSWYLHAHPVLKASTHVARGASAVIEIANVAALLCRDSWSSARSCADALGAEQGGTEVYQSDSVAVAWAVPGETILGNKLLHHLKGKCYKKIPLPPRVCCVFPSFCELGYIFY